MILCVKALSPPRAKPLGTGPTEREQELERRVAELEAEVASLRAKGKQPKAEMQDQARLKEQEKQREEVSRLRWQLQGQEETIRFLQTAVRWFMTKLHLVEEIQDKVGAPEAVRGLGRWLNGIGVQHSAGVTPPAPGNPADCAGHPRTVCAPGGPAEEERTDPRCG